MEKPEKKGEIKGGVFHTSKEEKVLSVQGKKKCNLLVKKCIRMQHSHLDGE